MGSSGGSDRSSNSLDAHHSELGIKKTDASCSPRRLCHLGVTRQRLRGSIGIDMPTRTHA
ncbi:Protein of unknown function [Pyronema omphalodes CBS 100304]|uniref:Uncharacterized protein n=1 Tax=Pyronema omphalodes (strain CBS 100304) TaxID=1076935 RepID=U4LI29_PYROM|nr:Protein of unknown function [Pyronema omphalodes CBS 100304]